MSPAEQAWLRALLNYLILHYPGLTPAVLLEQLYVWAEDFLQSVKSNKDFDPGPGYKWNEDMQQWVADYVVGQ